MKHVLSISLGSSRRNKTVEATLLGESFRIERVGTDGDKKKFRELLLAADGRASVITLGGVNLYVYCDGARYTFRTVSRLIEGVTKTPIVDGSGLKNTLERSVIAKLFDGGSLKKSDRVLLVSAVDRFGMADELRARGCDLKYGDLAFALGIPLTFSSWGIFKLLARTILPLITRLPIEWVYPTGEKQETIVPAHGGLFRWADVIAGDFHFIRRNLPERLEGKTILTNTTTEEDVALLRSRGVRQLITTTPAFDGRSFGTNVMEGVCVSLLGEIPSDPEKYMQILEKLHWAPNVTDLQAPTPPVAQRMRRQFR